MARYEMTTDDMFAPVGTISGSDALFELGLSYASGRDGTIDLVMAHKWFNLAALRGNEAAKHFRQEIGAELTRAEIARAQKLAREWLSTH